MRFDEGSTDHRELSREIKHLGKQSNGYAYECERNSQTALAKWIEHRRAQARVPIQVDPKILETYVGQYQFETIPDRILTVSRKGGRLFVDIPRNHKSELFSESNWHLAKMKGQVTHVEYVSNGEALRAKKIK